MKTIENNMRIRPGKRKQYAFAFKITKPEFNLYDKETKTQILLASDQDTLGVVFKEFLQFDLFEQDPKTYVKIIFNQVLKKFLTLSLNYIQALAILKTKNDSSGLRIQLLNFLIIKLKFIQ